MKYEWEDGVSYTCALPDGYRLLGLAVKNMETGEGAFISMGNNATLHDVREADITHSLCGDGEDTEWETVQWVDFMTVDGWGRYPFMIWVPLHPTHWMPLPVPPATP